MAPRPAVTWLDQQCPRNVVLRALPIPKENPPQGSSGRISLDEIRRERYRLIRRHLGTQTSCRVALRIREVGLGQRQAGVRCSVSGLKRDRLAVHLNATPKVIDVPAKEDR